MRVLSEKRAAFQIVAPNGLASSSISNTWDVLNQLTAQSAAPATGVIGDTSVTTDYDALGRWTKIVDGDTSQ